jgi:hypothetical protein
MRVLTYRDYDYEGYNDLLGYHEFRSKKGDRAIIFVSECKYVADPQSVYFCNLDGTMNASRSTSIRLKEKKTAVI